MDCPSRRGRHRPAFSLVELLTVVVCVVLLVLLVQPSLHLSRERAKLSVCLDRLRAIGSASEVYASDDASGWAIPVHPLQYQQDPDDPTFIGAYEWGGKSGIGQEGFAPLPGILGSRYGTRAGFGPVTRPMNAILYPHGFRDNLNPLFIPVGAVKDTQLNLPAYRCPSDDGPPDGGHCPDWLLESERTSYDHFGNSYAANLFMISSGGPMFSNSPYMRSLGRVPNPTRTIFFEENIGRWAWAAREDRCDFLPGINLGATRTIRGWHGKTWTYNRVFGDAHAETQSVYIEGTEDADGYANHYVPEHLPFYPDWDSDADGIPDVPGSFTVYSCVIIRGPGWQKDTLPDAALLTGLATPGGTRASYEDCVGDE